MSNGRIAVCPGTYDPVTNGHLDIIGRAARVFDRVVVGVVNQPVRKQTTLFTAEERKALHRGRRGRRIDNVEVEVFSTLLVEFAREHGATAIVKGLRAISDFEYEFEMNQLNRKLAPGHRVASTSSPRPTTASSPRPASRRWRPSAATSPTWSRPASPRRCASA